VRFNNSLIAIALQWSFLCTSILSLFMSTGLKKYLSHLLIALVALQVLNLGLYAQDFELAPVSAFADQNIINSVTEYIAEVLLNKVNAFPEKKESSNQSNQNEHEMLFKFQPFKIMINQAQDLRYALSFPIKSYNCFRSSHYANHSEDIISPPPKG
jgi:hypothetical protein